jgi:hypothetical protein
MSRFHRLLGSLRKDKLEDQLNEELQFHIEMRTRESSRQVWNRRRPVDGQHDSSETRCY